MSNLFPFAARLAAAIQRRQYLDDLACDGQGVPAQVTRANEEEIRVAEVEMIRATEMGPPDPAFRCKTANEPWSLSKLDNVETI
jgi:hypothetical protein